MTDLTPEKRAELRAETIAGKRSHEARGLVSTVTVLSDTLLSLLDALDEKERELTSAAEVLGMVGAESLPCEGQCGLAMPEPGMCLGCLSGARIVNRNALDSLRRELAAAKAASELSTAEREVVRAAVAKQEHADTFSAFANPTRRETQKANDLADALDDAVQALRAQEAEG